MRSVYKAAAIGALALSLLASPAVANARTQSMTVWGVYASLTACQYAGERSGTDFYYCVREDGLWTLWVNDGATD